MHALQTAIALNCERVVQHMITRNGSLARKPFDVEGLVILPDYTGDTPLYFAGIQRSAEVAAILLAYDATLVTQKVGKRQEVALHAAAIGGSVEIAKLLLGHGAEIDPPDIKNETPLYCAISLVDKEMTRFLLKNNANADIPNEKGTTPRELASLIGNGMSELLAEFANVVL